MLSFVSFSFAKVSIVQSIKRISPDSTKRDFTLLENQLKRQNINKCEIKLKDKSYDASHVKQSCWNADNGYYVCAMSCGVSKQGYTDFTVNRSYWRKCSDSTCRKGTAERLYFMSLMSLEEMCFHNGGITKANRSNFSVSFSEKNILSCFYKDEDDVSISICSAICTVKL